MITMRAAQFDSYGGPEVLHIATVPLPSIQEGELLIHVAAAGVNPHDAMSRAGRMKFVTGRKFPLGTGIEFAGEVVEGEAFGLTRGQHVWGSVPAMKPHSTGAVAEYVAVPGDRVALAPEGLSAIEAGSLVVASTTAIRALRQVTELREGERVLIRGAAGGVGRAAVEVAVEVGAQVTTLSSSRDFDALKALGAIETLDYRTIGPRDLEPFDVVFDSVGTDLLSYQKLLSKGGRMVTIAFTSVTALLAIGLSLRFGSRRIRVFSSDAHKDLLDAAADLVRAGSLHATVGRTFSLDDIQNAHKDLQVGGASGKRVVVF